MRIGPCARSSRRRRCVTRAATGPPVVYPPWRVSPAAGPERKAPPPERASPLRERHAATLTCGAGVAAAPP
ncbi:hypothetical protein [Lysobacter gummosus]|uniref:hypothetical protein n=1 Tax=Lysobacter gummosus TaxID=262324 RepID=UPI00363AEC2C